MSNVYLKFDGYAWKGANVHEYKGNPDVVKYVLFGKKNGLKFEVRVFIVKPGGATSLEKHKHQHAVVVLEGEGWALVGDKVYEIKPFDGIWVPPMTPHRFVANKTSNLKILCIVDVNRDRPVALSGEEIERILSLPGGKIIVKP